MSRTARLPDPRARNVERVRHERPTLFFVAARRNDDMQLAIGEAVERRVDEVRWSSRARRKSAARLGG